MKKTPHTEAGHGTLTSYSIGFALSIILTLIPYFFVANHMLNGAALVWSVVTLALVQLFVQLVFFLHLGRDSKPRWNLVVFVFTILVVLILVFGTLWIMKNLDYNMSPMEVESHILNDEAIPR
ncbi:MAG TPA: cytochrome o ubiquinol oxidase subunit IV [Verrucomicrobiae bacterium]|nr:cytochrome o ubiquinol oxidase subunit IV [Verrucomicrobiae bacterium]